MALNPKEEALFKRWSDPAQYGASKTVGLWGDGVSRSVASAIAADVELVLPNVSVTDRLAVLEFGHQFSEIDGLIDYFYTPIEEDPVLDQKFLQTAYYYALTTIWIANYTRLMEKSRRKKLSKWQYHFQVALLCYFFNRVSPVHFPESLYVEQVTTKKYGLNGWFFDDSQEKEQVKMERFFDILHCFSLEYC